MHFLTSSLLRYNILTTLPLTGVYINVNGNVYVYCLKSPLRSANLTIYAHGICYNWNSLLHSLISSAENSAFAHFAAAVANHTVKLSRSTRYPSLLGGQWQRDIRDLPSTSTHDHQGSHVLPLCESCSRTTSPCICSTQRVVYAMSTRAAPH